mmetsp:Transcript_63292/g.137696  ORF Transcript_63292/g.137696 Transcript_63292/m.137696 type:complete len:300 (+) Transcript_63292:33-932(+)
MAAVGQLELHCALPILCPDGRAARGDGSTVPARLPAALAAIPCKVAAAWATGSGVAAATCVSPFILTIDRAITECAAGRRNLVAALRGATGDVLLRPHQVIGGPAFWMVLGVYASTYTAANTIEVFGERANLTPVQVTMAKLFGTTAVNMTASIAKDAAFAKMFGAVSARPMPTAAYGIFVLRDTLTMAAAFSLPPVVASELTSKGIVGPGLATTVAQVATPMAMQLVCTPLHLLALDQYNSPRATLRERARSVCRTLPQCILTRMFRVQCAYGIGGLMNSQLMSFSRRYNQQAYSGTF